MRELLGECKSKHMSGWVSEKLSERLSEFKFVRWNKEVSEPALVTNCAMSDVWEKLYEIVYWLPFKVNIALFLCFSTKDVRRLLTLSKYSGAVFCILDSTSPRPRGQVKLRMIYNQVPMGYDVVANLCNKFAVSLTDPKYSNRI